MPTYLTAVYNIGFSYLRAHYIRSVGEHVFLKIILQLISVNGDKCRKITSFYKSLYYFCWKAVFYFSFCFIFFSILI